MPAKPADIPFREEFNFLKGLIASPKGVGAVTPSSPALARAIAAELDPAAAGKVLELGPGTGVVTEALIARGFAPERIIAVEYDADFARLVKERCPGVTVIVGDAFGLAKTLGPQDAPFSGIVSGVPLLNHPMAARRALVDGGLARVREGGVLVQFSYGLTPPVPATDSFNVERAAVIWRNLPPARVWVYRRR